MRPAEQCTIAINTALQMLLGRWAEPLATKVAKPMLRRGDVGNRDATRGGLRWQLDLKDNAQRRLYFVGTYERAVFAEVVRRLRPGDFVLDVGANIGTFSLPVATACPGVEVLAIEPASDSANRLQEHAKRNSLDHRVHILRLALGASCGSLALRRGADPLDTGLRSTHGIGEIVETVSVVRGDDILREFGRWPAVIKVDVEGHELAVLNGLDQALTRARTVVIEVVPQHQVRGGASVTDVAETLAGMGFRAQLVRNRGLRSWTGQPGNVMFSR